MNIFNVPTFTRLKYWVQMALPLVYDDSLSYMELLCKVVEKLNELGEDYNQLIDELSQKDYDYNQMKQDIALLQEEMEKVKRGDYISNYIDALSKWIDANLQELVGKIARFVIFGLTDTGYFFADIPENWEFVHFGTIYDENDPNWLHLYLDY